MSIEFHALPTKTIVEIRRSGIDSYGNAVERHVSDGHVYPCRHCLGVIPKGEEYLILAHRPFVTANAYAETGPIFLCATDCECFEPSSSAPDILRSPGYIVRAYSADERIIYGTGRVTPTPDILAYATTLLDDPKTAFVDVRSAANNCFQCRVFRA